jgi:hypothetical protein
MTSTHCKPRILSELQENHVLPAKDPGAELIGYTQKTMHGVRAVKAGTWLTEGPAGAADPAGACRAGQSWMSRPACSANNCAAAWIFVTPRLNQGGSTARLPLARLLLCLVPIRQSRHIPSTAARGRFSRAQDPGQELTLPRRWALKYPSLALHRGEQARQLKRHSPWPIICATVLPARELEWVALGRPSLSGQEAKQRLKGVWGFFTGLGRGGESAGGGVGGR